MINRCIGCYYHDCKENVCTHGSPIFIDDECTDYEDNDFIKQIKTNTIEEVMKKAESIQLEQIENLNKSTRRNGKMWARHMSTYLGNIQVACKRMLEIKE